MVTFLIFSWSEIAARDDKETSVPFICLLSSEIWKESTYFNFNNIRNFIINKLKLCWSYHTNDNGVKML